MFETEFVCTPTARHPSCHCASVVELANGDLLCCWYAGEGEAKPNVQILTARKPAGAREWLPPEVAVDDDPNKPMGNCILWEDARGRVWLFYNVMHGKLEGHWGPGVRWDTCDSRYRISEDGGRTWGEVQWLRREYNNVFRTKPLVTSKGSVIIGVEHSRENSHFFISPDGGETWTYTGKIPGVPCSHPTQIERSDGSILALLRPEEYPLVGRSVSLDGGYTWSLALNTDLPNPGAAVDMVKLTDGRVALAFNNSYRRRSPLSLALSLDEGETWPYIRDVDAGDIGEYSYPGLIQGRDGRLHLVYTWRRTHIKHAAVEPDWILGAAAPAK